MAEKETTSVEKKKHKEWRKEAKKLRRQKLRQKLAEERRKLVAEEETARLKDPNYIKWLHEQEELESLEREQEEHERQKQEELWLRRELLAQKIFREQQQKQEATAAAKEAERQRIQKEFEELQLKSQQRREERKRREEQAKKDHELMMGKIFDYIELGGKIPEELTTSVESNPNKTICPFFTKTNACRFGVHCMRNHIRPKLSRILFFPNFFSHIQLEHGGTSHGRDINLECSESDLRNDYKAFFEDVTQELMKFGDIVNFRACKNTQPHLRGNVLVEYSTERGALKAYVTLQGRFYAKRQINVEFSAINSWKDAVCGLSFTNKCPKGADCNYLHIFKNPGNLFNKPIKRKDEDEAKNLQNESRQNSIVSWNDVKDHNSDRNWRWSESPEHNSTTSQKNRNDSTERYRSRERSSRNDGTGRTQSNDRKSSSRNSRVDSHRSEDSSKTSRRRKKKRNKSKTKRSRSKSRERKERSKSKNGKKKRSRSRSREKLYKTSLKDKYTKRSRSKSPHRTRKHQKEDDREKHDRNKSRNIITKRDK